MRVIACWSIFVDPFPPKLKYSLEDARKTQEELKRKIVRNLPLGKVRSIAGADISMRKGSMTGHAGIVVFSYPELTVIEKTNASGELSFPYIPGFLAFREAPLLLKAIAKLKNIPDLFLFDGHGIAHPRGVGLASHMGVLLDRPAVGCAKSKLVGNYEEPSWERGARSLLRAEDGGVLGCVLRSRDGCKPLFVSEGHKVNLEEAVEIVLHCCKRYRLPEPTRQVHIYVNEIRKGYEISHE